MTRCWLNAVAGSWWSAMRIDYDVIGQLADEIGCRRADLIVLSPQNDPFYAGVAARREAAEWFARLWGELELKAGSHLRRIHYVLVSLAFPKANGEPYLNTENDWKMLGTASLAARYHRLIPDRALVDRRNDPATIFAIPPTPARPATCGTNGETMPFHDEIDDTVLPPWLQVTAAQVPQPFLVEVWVEKSTQDDILNPLARQLGFNIQPGAGETSEVLARDAISRAIEDGRPMRILYISDFDPGGRSMPVALARKIEFWLRELDLDLDITIEPILLTPEQCAHYKLPRTPLKVTERRAKKFEERFGEGATELDALEALHPGEIAKIVEAEVCRYIDPSLDARLKAANSAFKRRVNEAEDEVHKRFDISDFEERIDELVSDFKADREALQEEGSSMWAEIAGQLTAVAPEFDPEDLPTPRRATPTESPLFDSKRSYLDQIDHYRNWQGRDGGAA
jgi:hypothetical protein